MGGRICSMVAADDDRSAPALGLALLGYPLHPPGKPETLRVEHFPRLTMPVLFVSGTRDAFGTPAELKRHAKKIKGAGHVPLDRDRRPRLQAAEVERPHRGRRARRRGRGGRRASLPSLARSPATCETARVRVDRWFAFVDLSGFTSFGDEYGDDESVRVLTLFRGAVRKVATDFGVRIAKWLGDGCMLVSVEPDAARRARCASSSSSSHELELPLAMHAGMAGGAVILLEGDDYTGGSRQPRVPAHGRGRTRTRSSRRRRPRGVRARPGRRSSRPG